MLSGGTLQVYIRGGVGYFGTLEHIRAIPSISIIYTRVPMAALAVHVLGLSGPQRNSVSLGVPQVPIIFTFQLQKETRRGGTMGFGV